MRFILIFILLFSCFICEANYQPKDGDIIFQSSQSSQSKAVEQATNSPYSHMGIIFIKMVNLMYLKLGVKSLIHL